MKKCGFAFLLLVLGLPGVQAGELEIVGRVAEVQLVDVTELNDERFLILSLEQGQSFLLPGATQVAAGRGAQVAVRHLPVGQGELSEACSIRVLALPIRVEGEEVLQPARRPFEVYSNPDDQCD